MTFWPLGIQMVILQHGVRILGSNFTALCVPGLGSFPLALPGLTTKGSETR